MNEFQTLTVQHYDEDSKENKRITISPMNVVAVIADAEDCTVNGRTLRNVVVLFVDSGNIAVCVDHSDLSLLESAIGSFCLG